MSERTINFLTGPERFALDVPDEMRLLEASTTIAYGGFSHQLIFRTTPESDPQADPEFREVSRRAGKNGVGTATFERFDAPLRVLVWRVGAGMIMTAFNEADYGSIDRFVDTIDISDAPIPAVAYSAPFSSGSRKDTFAHDEVVFASADRSQELRVTKPPANARLNPQAQDTTSWIERMTRAKVGLVFRWYGPAGARAAVETGVASVSGSARQTAP